MGPDRAVAERVSRHRRREIKGAVLMGIKEMKYATLVCACLACIHAYGAEDKNQTEPLQESWSQISPSSNEGAPGDDLDTRFRLGIAKIDAFCAAKIEGYSEVSKASRDDMARVIRVITANKERGCIWLIYRSRLLSTKGLTGALRAARNVKYREYYQYLADLLRDTRPLPGHTGASVAPFMLYRPRVCDVAYWSLSKRLRSAEKLGEAARKAGYEWPLRRLPDRMTYAKRNEHIFRLWTILGFPEAARYVSSQPSALEALKKSKEMTDEVKTAERILGRCRPKLIKLTIPKEEMTLSALLDNEQPPLTAKEKKSRERLLKKEYSAKVVVSRLPQSRLRDRGLIEWVILHREDRMDIATSLIAMYEDDKYPLMRLPLIELMAELLRTWKSVDPPAANKIVEFVKKISADKKTHWTVKEVASEILSGDIGRAGALVFPLDRYDSLA